MALLDEMYSDESMRGYALRMAGRNGLRKGLRQLAQVMGLKRISFSDPDAGPSIARMFGANTERARRLTVKDNRAGVERAFELLGKVFSRTWLLRLHHPQICGACIAENGYARVDWDIQLVTCCRAHGCMLCDTCWQCAKRISWSRPHLQRCQCGADLGRSETIQADPLSLAVSIAVAHRLALPHSARLGEMPVPPSVLADISLDGLMRLVVAFGVKSTSDEIIGLGRMLSAFRTQQMSAIAVTGWQRLIASIDSAAPVHRQMVSMIHVPMLLSIARDGQGPADRALATQLLLLTGSRHWASVRLDKEHPQAQLTLF